MENYCFVNLYNCENTWFASCMLWTMIFSTAIFHDKSIANAPSMKRFRSSFAHRFFRGTGPLPTIFILCSDKHIIFLFIAIICQGFVLGLHFLTRYLIKKFNITFRPSGHSRVAMNLIIYFAYFEQLSNESNVEFNQIQLTLAYIHCAILFSIAFVSGLSFHPVSELVAGMLLCIPQILFLQTALFVFSAYLVY